MGGDDEEDAAATDNSVARLLTLCDGVFAIAMTLLALDLKVPSSAGHVTEATLVHELRQHVASYLSFGFSFFVVASYWGRHRRLMRSIERVDDALIGQTLLLLFCVAVLPFPTALLGQFGSHAISLTVYGSVNILAAASMLRLHYIVRHHELVAPEAIDQGRDDIASMLGTAIVFVLCIPAGYVLPHHGAWILLLIIPAQRWHLVALRLRDRRSRRAAAHRVAQ